MPIHSILPPEAYLEEAPQPQAVCKRCRYGFVDCLPMPDGRLQIRRVISTDPAAYLDPKFSPGEIYQENESQATRFPPNDGGDTRGN